MDNIIRLDSIIIKNVKNVKNGSIKITSKINQDGYVLGANIIGLYGQNGSGKTALIESIKILKAVIEGKTLAKDIKNIISIKEKQAEFEFQYYIHSKGTQLLVKHNFKIQKTEEDILRIIDEKLSYKNIPSIKGEKFKVLVEHSDVINPSNLKKFFNENEETRVEYQLLKGFAAKESRSFIFSSDFLNRIKTDTSFSKLYNLLTALKYYSQRNLVVIENKDAGVINADIFIPVSFQYQEGSTISYGKIGLSLNSPNEFKEKEFVMIKNIIDQLNIVLNKIIPDRVITLKSLGSQFNESGEKVYRFQLFSNNGEAEFPLKYESDGIKKIISILSSLIVVYNDPSYCLVIDELDAGIFEYLLGEVLEIISKFGKGQLIFTSHNLRPLEVLDKDSLIFTTTNRSNNYTRIPNIKPTNNIRSVYMRSVFLGSDGFEQLYKETDSYEIKKAFRKAKGGVNE